MKLYHYTSIHHIPSIIDHGSLWKGDIPLTNSMHIGQEGNAVWLTTCEFANPSDHGLGNPFCDKSEIRFTIEIDEDDPRLFKWSDYARLNNVEPSWYKMLDEVSGGSADTWWLFISPIRIAGLEVARKINGCYVELENNVATLPDGETCQSSVQNSM